MPERLLVPSLFSHFPDVPIPARTVVRRASAPRPPRECDRSHTFRRGRVVNVGAWRRVRASHRTEGVGMGVRGRKRKRSRKRWVIAIAVSFVVLVVGGAGALYLKLNANISTFDA